MSGRRHIERAEHHSRAAQRFRETYPDWTCTALFYAAVHYVNAALIDDRSIPAECRKPTSHNAPGTGRTQIVNVHYQEIANEYRALESMSRIARYSASQQELVMLAAVADQLPAHLEEVRKFCVARREANGT